jgi:hypothetical protein
MQAPAEGNQAFRPAAEMDIRLKKSGTASGILKITQVAAYNPNLLIFRSGNF